MENNLGRRKGDCRPSRGIANRRIARPIEVTVNRGSTCASKLRLLATSSSSLRRRTGCQSIYNSIEHLLEDLGTIIFIFMTYVLGPKELAFYAETLDCHPTPLRRTPTKP